MKNKILRFFRQTYLPENRLVTPRDTFWIGASIGVLFLVFFCILSKAVNTYFGIEKIWIVLIAIATSVLLFMAFGILLSLVLKHLKYYPAYFIAALGGSIGLLLTLKEVGFGIPKDYFYYGGLFAIVAVAMLFGGLFVLFSGQWRKFKTLKRYLIIACLLLGGAYLSFTGFWLLREGENIEMVDFSQNALDPAYLLDLPNPSEQGPFEIEKFTYGSGVNRMRKEFGEEVDYKSEVVNGKYILPAWRKKQAKKRSWYWGFDVEQWPINGITWMPVGKGPFPVVLIVHGNHSMEEYSDPGYAYLGELLASRGYITVSVDENFINGSWAGDFRGKELPARAWLLLKHLAQWRTWNNDASHELSGKADLTNVALIGHSRGGEAVPIAAAFNRLSYFPDDSREKFDFNFGIKTVIAIAPTDYRYDRRVRIENVDFLGLQGSYDSDEDSFYGLRQLQRTDFKDTNFHMKAGVYIHGANHGQFNSIWGRHDAGFPQSLFLNTKPMISGEEQRKYAEVLISAFLETSIKGNQKYSTVFQDLRKAADWLPQETLALSLYEDTNTKYWADFEEDIELSTTGSGRVTTEGFDIWAEDYLQFRAGMHQENHALVLGWLKDSIPDKAIYEIEFDTSVSLSKNDFLTLSIGAGNPSLFKDSDIKVKEDSLVNDVMIILKDSLDNQSTIKLSDYKRVTPRLKIRFLKTKKLTTKRYKNEWEPNLESVYIPVNAFAENELDVSNIVKITIQANTEKGGIILLDRIGVLRENQ